MIEEIVENTFLLGGFGIYQIEVDNRYKYFPTVTEPIMRFRPSNGMYPNNHHSEKQVEGLYCQENKKSQSQQAAGYLVSWDFLILNG